MLDVRRDGTRVLFQENDYTALEEHYGVPDNYRFVYGALLAGRGKTNGFITGLGEVAGASRRRPSVTGNLLLVP